MQLADLVHLQDFADIVPPCQALIGVSSGEAGTGTSNPALAEGGVIHPHEGIQGGADLVPAIHGWDVNAPVAEVTVERIVADRPKRRKNDQSAPGSSASRGDRASTIWSDPSGSRIKIHTRAS